MKVVLAAAVAFTAVTRVLAASDTPRPRGVGPECNGILDSHYCEANQVIIIVSKHYKSPDSFKCINNPDITLDISQINDDYCDCPDGSDEPGTSACSHLNDSLAIPGFYCKNKGDLHQLTSPGQYSSLLGHTPTYVPLTYVNDGVCDYDLCCDGSDEWEGIGEKCPDKCKEIGQEWRKQNEQRQKALGAAAKGRRDLVTEAGRLKKEVEDRIETLKTQITGAEIKVQNLEQEFAETEKREKARVVRAPKEGGKLGMLVTLAKQRTEELRTNLERVVKERDDAQSRLKELESMLTTFKEEYNPNFNDEGVKRAVRAWEDYAARDKPMDADLALERDLKEVIKADSENGLRWSDWEHEESDVDVCKFFRTRLLTTLSNNPIQCTSSKNTFHNPYETGSTKSSETCE
jgi:protein kinase C substrate 80K-H